MEILRLARNVGHQRAIALGAAHVREHVPCDAILVMDADGEDRPSDAAALVARCRERDGERIIFAERTRRSESALFQCFYRLYQLLHWLLTGIPVRVGNFSVVPAARLRALLTLPALWNHYAAAIFQARLPRELLPTVRGARYSGRSRMNLVALVIHGLQAISVFIDVVAVRVLITACLLAGACGTAFALTLAAGWFISVLPDWLLLIGGGSVVLSLGLVVGCFAMALGFLAQRNRLDFIPARDYRFFVEGVQRLGPLPEAATEALPQTSRRATNLVTSEGKLQP